MIDREDTFMAPKTQDPLARTDPAAGMERPTARGSLHRAVDILEAVYNHDGPARFSDITALTRMPKATLHRNIALMCKLGLLHQHEATGAYTIGLVVAKYGSKSLESHPLRQVAHLEMKRLRDSAEETVRLAVLEFGRVRYVDQLAARKPVSIPYNIGDTGPVHCSGTGKAILAAMQPDDARAILETGPIERFTDKTITDVSLLMEDLAAAATRGYVIEDGEQMSDIRAIGAAIKGNSNRVLGAISITVPAYRMSMTELEQHAPALRACVKRIEERATVSIAAGSPTFD